MARIRSIKPEFWAPVAHELVDRIDARDLMRLLHEPCSNTPACGLRGRTWVYEVRDKPTDERFAQNLLYVGITSNSLGPRLDGHRVRQPWWPEAFDVWASLHCCRAHALQEEGWLIHHGHPIHNKSRPHSSRVPVRPKSHIGATHFRLGVS